MAGPFHNNIKATSSGAAGTGAFTPSTATADGLAWSNVPTGWIGLVRYDDGTSWELRYGYWNGTTLSRPANGFVSSSSGTGLTLSASATAALVPDGEIVAPINIVPGRGYIPLVNNTALTSTGITAGTATGTAAAAALAATNYLTEQPRIQLTSATTANAQAGYSTAQICAVTSTSAGRGGWQFASRFGVSAVPTGPRLFAGMTSATFVANAGEPSAFTANYAAFALDSTDTNIQLLTNSNVSTGTKIDTGIPLAVNGWYHAQIWCDPGSTTIKALLIRMDTGAIYYGTTNTDVPANGSLLFPQVLSGLSATTGTAIVTHFGGLWVRTGGL